MKTKSFFSKNLDPYRAGLELAEALQEVKPEIIFLFSSIHFAGSEELAEAIYDVIDDDNLLIVGCTGDGFYEGHKAGNVGASALAINSNKAISWQLDHEAGVGLTPFTTTSNCLQRLAQSCPDAKFFLLFSDFRTDASEIIRAIAATTTIPVIGGMAGDNFNMEHCFLYLNRQVIVDSVLLLAVTGDIPFKIFTAHHRNPEGEQGVITSCQGTTLHTINNLPAMDFVETAMGKPLEHVDRGTITANVIDRDYPQIIRHRSLLLSKDPLHNKDIHLFGGMQEGDEIQLCLTSPDNIVNEVKQVATDLAKLDFTPAAALLVSCAGRKQLLGNQNNTEVDTLRTTSNAPAALAGFPSLGEIGSIPIRPGSYLPVFYNMTYVLLAFGEA